MDRGKRPGRFLGARNNKIYMDLKDIIREHTLSFLPAKSLFRFQCVCRDWNLQISTPFFAHNQSLAFRDTLGFFYQTPGNPSSFAACDPKSCGVPDPSLSFLPEPVEIRSSSNGLLCCQSRTGDNAYYICNPATRKWKILPKPNMNHSSNSSAVLIFQPSLLNFVAEYKLVCAFQSNDFDDALEFEVYSSAEGSWKVSGEICFVTGSVVPSSGVHDGNNVVYWRISKGSSTHGIIVYDVTKDRSQLLQSYYLKGGTLGYLNGMLCSSSVNGRTVVLYVLANIHTNTMTMNSQAKMWEEKQRVVIDSKVVGEDACRVFLVADNILVLKSGNTMYSCDLKTKETRALGPASVNEGGRSVPYVNSLISL